MTHGDAKRMPVTRQRALETAVAIADRDGIGRVTMRAIATELGIEAMSLYHHVANKDAILDGMVDLVFSEIELPAPESEWKPAMRDRALSARTALVAHPWAIGLLDSRATPGPATLRHHEAVLACLREGGFSLPMAAHAVSLIDSYVYGFVLQQVGLPFQTPEETEEVVGALVEAMPAADYPYLTELATELALVPGYDYANEFEFGLDLVLDALEDVRGA